MRKSWLVCGLKSLHNSEYARLGRLWLCWNPEKLEIERLVSATDQIRSSLMWVKFLASFVYAQHASEDRKSLWIGGRFLLNMSPLVSSLGL